MGDGGLRLRLRPPTSDAKFENVSGVSPRTAHGGPSVHCIGARIAANSFVHLSGMISSNRVLLSVVAAAAITAALLPPWTPTYNTALSTIIQPCENNALLNTSFMSQGGVVDVDWSNAKSIWSKAKPMNCEELLTQQVSVLKAANPNTKVGRRDGTQRPV